MKAMPRVKVAVMWFAALDAEEISSTAFLFNLKGGDAEFLKVYFGNCFQNY